MVIKMRGILFVILVLFGQHVLAQSERKYIRRGNDAFEQENYQEAETKYRKALGETSHSFAAQFNLADALYRQGKFEEAAKEFYALSNTTSDSDELADVYYNLGNTLLKGKKLKESIEAYKRSLKNRPGDMDAKHNLAFAQKLMQQQKQKQKQQDQQDQQDKQDQQEKKDQKDQQKQQDQKDKQDQKKKDQQQQNQQDQQKQEQQQKEQDQQQQQAERRKVSKEDAERMLKALENDEKALQKKIKKKKAQQQRVNTQKDW